MVSCGVIDRQGFELGYQVEGSGPSALIIGSSIYYPRVFSDHLRRHLRLVFSDNRAFAPEPRFELPLTFHLDLLLEDIECVRQKLKLDQMIIIGHSGNAFLALEYAKKYPQHVSHVVMIGASPDFSDQSQKSADQHWEESASAARKKALEERLEKNPDSQYMQIPLNQRFIWNYLRHTPRLWFDFAADYSSLWQGVHVNMPIFEYIWGTLFREIDLTKNIEDFDKPVLLALGRYDFVVTPPDSWNPFRSKFKDLSLLIFEKSGHSPFYEEPERFDTELLNWLASH